MHKMRKEKSFYEGQNHFPFLYLIINLIKESSTKIYSHCLKLIL